MYSQNEITKAINTIQSLLTRQFCRLTFSEFCKATGMVETPGDSYAIDKWNAFQALVDNWGKFDKGTMAAILAHDPDATEPDPAEYTWKLTYWPNSDDNQNFETLAAHITGTTRGIRHMMADRLFYKNPEKPDSEPVVITPFDDGHRMTAVFKYDVAFGPMVMAERVLIEPLPFDGITAKAILLGDKILVDRSDGIEKVFKVTGPDTFKQIDAYCEAQGIEITNKESFLWWSDREKYYAGLETPDPNMPKWKIWHVTGETAKMELVGVFNGTRREVTNHCFDVYREQFNSPARVDLDVQSIDDGVNNSVRVFAAGAVRPVNYIHAVKVGEF
jgi:hypothetical protein